jgi:hypothetical protein
MTKSPRLTASIINLSTKKDVAIVSPPAENVEIL